MLPGSREGLLLNFSRAELVARRVSQLVYSNLTSREQKYSRVAYIYVRSRAKYLKFRTTTSKINTLRKSLMQQKYHFVHEM